VTDSETKLLPSSDTFVVDGIEIDPTRDGFTFVESYGLYFWMPLLGVRTYATWLLLKSFCWGSRTKSWPSISRLSRILSNGPNARNTIAGRAGHPGTLDHLIEERIIYTTTEGDGPTTKHTYHVLRVLPLLTPEQLAKLTPALQRDHRLFLQHYRISHQHYLEAVYGIDDDPGAPSTTPWCAQQQGVGTDAARGAAPSSTNQHKESSQKAETKNLPDWPQILVALELKFPKATYDMWLKHTRALALDQSGLLTVSVTNRYAAEWLHHRLNHIILDTIQKHAPHVTAIRYIEEQQELF